MEYYMVSWQNCRVFIPLSVYVYIRTMYVTAHVALMRK
jgi:hypothetical protein